MISVCTLPAKGDVRDNVAAVGEQAVKDVLDLAIAAVKSSSPSSEIIYRPAVVGGMVHCTDRDNWGKVVEDLGSECKVDFLDGTAVVTLSKMILSLQDGTPLAESPAHFPKVRTFAELAKEFPKLRHPVIDGIIRKGETANLISVSKVGKSWLVGDLALSVLTGRYWLDSFAVEPGDVLILDNELHPETLAYRIEKIATARMIPPEDYEHLKVVSFRGQLVDIFALQSFFSQFKSGELQLVIVDALYRFMPDGIDENSNAGITKIYNQLDRIAAQLDCAIVCVHHASKGNQSGKAVIDVGSGAGAQSRATDAHLVLRPHKEDGAVVLEAACRSWPPIEPRVLRWNWPVWELADDLNAADLKSERGQKGSRAADVEAMKTNILETFIHFPEGATKTDIRSRVGQGKVFDTAWLSVCNGGDVVECEILKANNRTFSGFKRVYKSDDSDF
jgi:hypothetical protein